MFTEAMDIFWLEDINYGGSMETGEKTDFRVDFQEQ